jgi:hypothetical protein
MSNETKTEYQFRRIADALEEVLRLVKEDQEAAKKKWEYKPEEENRPQFKV